MKDIIMSHIVKLEQENILMRDETARQEAIICALTKALQAAIFAATHNATGGGRISDAPEWLDDARAAISKSTGA